MPDRSADLSYERFVDRFDPPAITGELIGRARALAPRLRDRAAEAERQRMVQPETIADMRDAGLFRLMQPIRYGGHGREFADYICVAEELGGGCPSTAWIYANIVLKTWMLGMFEEAAQDDVWADDPDTIVSSILRQTGTARPVDGGYLLNGEWSYVSGVDHTQWTIIGAMREAAGADGPPLPVFHLVPRADYRIVDTWHVAGLVATGSKNIVCADAFVPEHRTLPIPVAQSGRPPGLALHGHPVYRVPLMSSFGFFICAPLLGMACGALEVFRAEARERATVGGASGTRTTMRDLATIQTRAAEAEMKIDAARAHMLDAAVATLHQAVTTGAITDHQRIANRRAQAYSSKLAQDAITDIMGAMGAAGLLLDQPIQRYWRDVQAGAAHFGVNWDALRIMCGQFTLGLDPELKYY